VVGHAGDRQQLVDAAERDHQPVVGDVPVAALGVDVVHPVLFEVERVGLAEHQPDAG